MGGGGKGKHKNDYKNPIRLTIGVEGVWVGSVRGYTTPRGSGPADLALDQFIEIIHLEPEKADGSNIGHPLYRPFMLRRHGHNVGLAEASNLAYDTVTTRHRAWMQLEEGMRVVAQGTLDVIDDLDLGVGDTISLDDTSMGVRRLFLITGLDETHESISFHLVDVIGG